MAAPTLTPNLVEELTGVSYVNGSHIELAEQYIADNTGNTVTEHVDTRGIPVVSARAAVAIVSVRVADQMRTAQLEKPASETQGDYSYTASPADLLTHRDLLAGLPRDLLRLTAASWSRATYGAAVQPHPFWQDIDMQPDGFVR